MDEFTKQRQLEDHYKRLKDTFEYDPLAVPKKENYVETPPTQIINVVKEKEEEFQTEYKMEFNKASEDFWKRKSPESMSKYIAGQMVGSFGEDRLDIKDFFERLSRLIKECIIVQLSTKGYTTESLKNHFVIIDSTLKNLSTEIIKMDSQKKLSATEFSAFVHGFINNYVDCMIKKKG